MFRKTRAATLADQDRQSSYPLNWPCSLRWNPQYNVPRNSLEIASPRPEHRNTTQPISDTQGFHTSKRYDTVREGAELSGSLEPEEDGLSNLSHWLETLAELYMNTLDNRARWDPRWLNITHRERYDGLKSASIQVVDYLAGESAPRRELVEGKKQLATALQSRPENSEVRVVMVTDLSRFVMGALGQLYTIDPEFWFEHLVNSGYAASDSQLKVSNAVWMNWAEQETRFRHRALPGIGQRTEWNCPRREHGRCWAHLRWGRLGLLHYLGKKGFHEDEIDKRLGDGRWMIERDVVLDKHGLLMTEKRLAKAKRGKEKRERRKQPSTASKDTTSSRVKATNVYRAYTTFEGLPKNVSAWTNRDLRVMAPEGASYWSGQDHHGKKTIVLLLDPIRNMRNETTNELTPSLTFMPRAMELESYSEEELWRTAGPEETYLDPPPPPLSKAELKQQKKDAMKRRLKEKRERLRGERTSNHDSYDGSTLRESGYVDDSVSSYTSDEEYDEDYEKQLRAEYSDPKPPSRDRDYARKYSLPTHDLMHRYMSTIATKDILGDESLIFSILGRLILDDFWQLLAQMRLDLDHLDNDLSAGLYEQLVESIGNSTRQNLSWMRATLKELHEWAGHLSSSTALHWGPGLASELAALNTDLQVLQSRAEQTLNILATSMTLAQSSLVIDQTSGINKLTELAFFFVPISFITSIFSMQVFELTSAPPRIWTWGLSLTAVALSTYLIRSSLRSPSVRIAVLHCRATIINRFSSSKAGSASRRLKTVGNRAIAKFLFFFACVVIILTCVLTLLLALLFLAFGGLWFGAAAAALYFIIIRWPEPAVLVPCFLSLPVAAIGIWTTWYWSDEITDWATGVVEGSAVWIKRIFPAHWTLDNADDEDLAKEGVNTYARQAIVLAT
ncbi:Uncharacterized protein TPAR_07672 [Tolypocladium paradoxum]|uniref:Mg2+ transporter protein, CorA-like/Zinc transport protein ZntB n=1 Tax=Tolypocladium paradoxum TaxID=94208 RepID=A0A2S4KPI0_9HYPO|nr:Uncharacterized protein TPAR_07672 [Tolypocladium paradoxum]